jgi:aminoglycoside 3-N-acetyltransferase
MNLRTVLPPALLSLLRRLRRLQRRRALQARKRAGHILNQNTLAQQLRAMGIAAGDVLLVHASMGRMGYLEEGPTTAVNALIGVLGPTGTLVMPSSPVKALQLDHARSGVVFDVRNTPSAMGALSEYFRTLPGTVRSLHPTEPVCARGPQAAWLIQDHHLQPTPYTADSPWGRVAAVGGKILYVGVTLDNAGTSLHVLEDAVPFKFPIYYPESFDFEVIDQAGATRVVTSKVHHPEWSTQRQCDALIPWFKAAGVLQQVRWGEAECLLLDADAMLQTMLQGYEQFGITMYTPHGS